MKRFRILAILVLAILALGLLGACSKVMETPTNLAIDLENEILTWSSVDHASRYVVKITYLDSSNKVETKTTTVAQFELSDLEAGNYDICVKVDGTSKYKESAWSEEIGYTKENAGGFTYTPINNSTEYELTKARKAKGEVVIPDTYKNKPVTVVGANAFKSVSGVTSIVVGNNVKKIAEHAFYNCSKMTSIVLPDSLTIIGPGAFQSCYSLQEVTLPAGVTVISDCAFYSCMALKSVTFKGEITEIQANAFDNCSSIKEFVIPDSVTTLGKAALANMRSLKTLTIGKNVEVIDEKTFYGCSALESVIFPEDCKLVEIGNQAFFRCYYYYEEVEYVDGVKQVISTTVSGIKSIELPVGVETIGEQAFAECVLLEEVNIPSTVKSVGKNAFSSTKVYNDAMNIRDYTEVEEENYIDFAIGAEERARSMLVQKEDETDEEFEERVQLLKKQMENWYVDKTRDSMAYFIVADSLEEYRAKAAVMRKADLTEEEEALFNETKYWLMGVSVYVKGYTKLLGTSDTTSNTGYVVYTKSSNGTAYVTDAEGNLNAVKGTMTRVIKDGTVGIADNVFLSIDYWSDANHVSDLDMVRLPGSVKYIGKYAFAYCKNLTRFYATSVNSVEIIGESAFAYDITLSNVQFASGVKSIGKYAFLGCERLDQNTENPELLVPNTVESISVEAFARTKLESSASGIVYAGRWIVSAGNVAGSVTLPTEKDKTVLGIAEYAFYANESFTGFVGAGINSIKYICRRAFYKCTGITSFAPDVKTSALTVYNDYVFYGCTNLNSVTVPRKVTSIGRSAFYKCESIREIDLSDAQIEYIGKFAFYKCTKLGAEGGVGLVLADPEDSVLTTIDSYAFYGCYSIDEETGAENGLKSIALPDTLTYLGEYAFANCSLLSEIDFGNGIAEIQPYTFKSCTGLKSLTIPSNIKLIDEYAFIKCGGLEELIFEGGEEIGDFAFYNSYSLKYVTFGDSVKHIGRYAFKGARDLKSVAIPETVEMIDANAFYACKNLTIYAESSAALPGWHLRWNSSNRPVFFNCTLSEDNSYVVGILMKEDGKLNINSFTTVRNFERKGYVFVGWDKEIPDTLPEGGIYVTAQWVEGYAINYYFAGDGINNPDNPYTYYSGSQTIVLATPTCYADDGTEMVFVGWFDADGNPVTEIPAGSTGEKTFIAIWTYPEPEEPGEEEGETPTE